MFKRLIRFFAPYRPDPAFFEARDDAYLKAFGVEPDIFHSTDKKAPHVDIYVFPPEDGRDYTVVLTGGMSDLPMSVPKDSQAPAYVELVLGIHKEENWALSLLKLVAEYPFAEDSFLDAYHTVPFGSEVGNGCSFAAFLIVEPRIVPDSLQDLSIAGRAIHFLQAVPITTAEYDYAVSEGCDRLEALLEERQCLIARDPARASVV